MDERVVQFRVGLVVVATLLIAATLMLYFGELPWLGQDTYSLFVRFPQAPRVTAETPVRKSGILIGRVRSVAFAEDDSHRPDDTGVIVEVGVYHRYQIRRDEVFEIDANLLGDATIKVAGSGDPNRPTTFYQPGEYIPDGRVRPDVLESLQALQRTLPDAIEQVGGAAKSVGGAAEKVGGLAERMDNLVAQNQEQVTRIVGKSELAVDKLNSVLTKTDEFLSDDQMRKSIKEAIGQAPAVMTEAQNTLKGIRRSFETLDGSLADLQVLTNKLREKGPGIVDKVDQNLTKLSVLMDDMSTFAHSFQTSEGSFGRLLNDPELYQNLNAAAINVERVTRELEPIVNDVRVFTDKISRHPGVLIRDAVRPGSGIK